MSKCIRCKTRDRKSTHFNAKYCLPCIAKLKKQPEAKNLGDKQKKIIRKYAGKIERKLLAEKAKTSIATLKRFAKAEDLNIKTFHYTKEEVQKVCTYYAKHGKVKTQKKFPEVKVRSIVERYLKSFGLESRQIRWTPKQLHEAAKMGGVVSKNAQALYFSRPRAYSGSIRSLWSKVFKCAPANLNGCPHWIAKRIVKYSCPFYLAKGKSTKIFAFWTDIKENLKPDADQSTKDLVNAMAKFQTWLHSGETPKIVFEREIY